MSDTPKIRLLPDFVDESDALPYLAKDQIKNGLVLSSDDVDLTDQYTSLLLINKSTVEGVPENITWTEIPPRKEGDAYKWIGTMVYDTPGDLGRVFQFVSNKAPSLLKDLTECDVYQSTSFIDNDGALDVSEAKLATSADRYPSKETQDLLASIPEPSETPYNPFDNGWCKLYDWHEKKLPDGTAKWIGVRNLTGDTYGPHDNHTDLEMVVLDDPKAFQEISDLPSDAIYNQRRQRVSEMGDMADEGLSDSGRVLWTVTSQATQKAAVDLDIDETQKTETTEISQAPVESSVQWANRVDFEMRYIKSRAAQRLNGGENGRDMTMAEKVRLGGLGVFVAGAALATFGVAPLALAGIAMGLGAISNIPIVSKLVQAHYYSVAKTTTDANFCYDENKQNGKVYSYDEINSAQTRKELGFLSISPIEIAERASIKIFKGFVGALSVASLSPLSSYLQQRYESKNVSVEKSFFDNPIISGVAKFMVGAPVAAAAIFTSPVWGGAAIGGLAVYGFAKGYLNSAAEVTPQEFYQSRSSQKFMSVVGVAEKFSRVMLDLSLGAVEGTVKFVSGLFSGQSNISNRLSQKRESKSSLTQNEKEAAMSASFKGFQ